MINTCTLIGSSSGRNAGDAALMSSIIEAIDSACNRNLNYFIPTIRPSYIKNNFPVTVKPVPTLPWNLSIKMLGLPTLTTMLKSDLILIFDAILFDRALFNPLFNFMFPLYLMLPIVKKRNKIIACYNVGLGPVKTSKGKFILRKILNLMDFITVRDSASMDLMKELDINYPFLILTSDAALNARACDDSRTYQIIISAGLNPSKEILGLNINIYLDTWSGETNKKLSKEDFLKIYSSAINKFLTKYPVQIVIIVTQHIDLKLSMALAGMIKSTLPVGIISNTNYNHYEIKGVLSKLSLLFAMRLHSIILASSSCTPVAGLAYQPKVHHYFDVLKLNQYSMSFADFSVENILGHLEKAWLARASIREHLEKVIPGMKKNALIPACIIAAIDKGLSIQEAFKRIYNPC